MALALKGPWEKAEIDSFLQHSTFPLRLACVGEDGFPRVVSVWYVFDGQHFRCVSHRSSQLIGLLEGNNRVGFELAPNEPPYHGVRGQGTVQLSSAADGKVLRTMLQRYLGNTESKLASWLLSRVEDEILITIEPSRLFTWDYRERMTLDSAPD